MKKIKEMRIDQIYHKNISDIDILICDLLSKIEHFKPNHRLTFILLDIFINSIPKWISYDARIYFIEWYKAWMDKTCTEISKQRLASALKLYQDVNDVTINNLLMFLGCIDELHCSFRVVDHPIIIDGNILLNFD